MVSICPQTGLHTHIPDPTVTNFTCNFAETDYLCNKEQTAAMFILLPHICVCSWHSNGPCTHTVSTHQSVLTGLHHLKLHTIHSLGGEQVNKGRDTASTDAPANVARSQRCGGPPRIMRLWPMLLLEACWGLARSLACLSSSVCLLLKPWSRCAPVLHPSCTPPAPSCTPPAPSCTPSAPYCASFCNTSFSYCLQ